MIPFFSFILLVALLAAITLGRALRRRLFLPVARLRHALRAAGFACGDSVASTVGAAATRLKALRTETRRTGRDLALLQSILERTHDGIIVVDADLNIVSANDAAARIFHQPQATLRGRRLTDVTREKQIYEGFRAALSQQTPMEGQIERIESAGRKVFQWRIIPLDDGNSAGVFLDVTELERLERVRQEFLVNVSHELRTPLTSILAYVETLLDGAIDDQENNIRFLGTIQKHARRLNSLIDDISDLSTIESGNARLDPTRLNLYKAVQEIMETLKPRARRLEVNLINSAPPDLTIIADGRRFEQILLNLIDNAVKFNRRGGQVQVEAQCQESKVAIAVADTGIGIPPPELPRIFERFYRVDKARSVELGGTGLGLAIVKHLIRIQGGEIRVESEPGKGTRFTILWPDVKPSQLMPRDREES